MVYSRMGVGGFVLIILVAALKGYNAYQRSNPGSSTPPTANSPAPRDYAAQMQRDMDRRMQQSNQMREQMSANRNQMLDRMRSSQQQIHESVSAVHDRNQQRAAEQRQRIEQAAKVPTYTPPKVTYTPAQPTYRPANPTQRPQAQPTPQNVAPEVKVVQPYDYSPKPDDALLEKYTPWQADQSYARFLGETYTFGDWQFRPSREFIFQRSNSRTAKWGVGKAGLGMDADVFKLYPRDKGMTSPVHQDNEDMQIFRLGRREIRARGNAEISHLESNGLMIWRIHTPAREGERAGSCYYMAILGEEDAILFTCRYAADKPEQIAAFDSVVQTLEYVKAEQ